MPAKSKAQQKLFGVALSVKRGETQLSDIDDEKIRKSVSNIVDNMTEKEIEKYASVSHKNLPNKIDEEGEATLDNTVADRGVRYPDGSNKKRMLSNRELRMLYRSKKASGELEGVSFEEFKKQMEKKINGDS